MRTEVLQPLLPSPGPWPAGRHWFDACYAGAP
ncbi:hypothetical protein EDD90_1465 [Streptomyces sp. Ag109_O5-1]|nr:hypothetical protein EDD90_1465 [Streptomyces sp. Ag109_O5-1]